MYILASDLFEKDDKYVFKARNSCCVQSKYGVKWCVFKISDVQNNINISFKNY